MEPEHGKETVAVYRLLVFKLLCPSVHVATGDPRANSDTSDAEDLEISGGN